MELARFVDGDEIVTKLVPGANTKCKYKPDILLRGSPRIIGVEEINESNNVNHALS